MLANVDAWEPPNENMVGLKALMQEQIKTSIEFDCTPNDYSQHWDKLPSRSGKKWRSDKMKRAAQDLVYYTGQQMLEEQRVEARNAWLRDLRASIGEPPVQGSDE